MAYPYQHPQYSQQQYRYPQQQQPEAGTWHYQPGQPPSQGYAAPPPQQYPGYAPASSAPYPSYNTAAGFPPPPVGLPTQPPTGAPQPPYQPHSIPATHNPAPTPPYMGAYQGHYPPQVPYSQTPQPTAAAPPSRPGSVSHNTASIPPHRAANYTSGGYPKPPLQQAPTSTTSAPRPGPAAFQIPPEQRPHCPGDRRDYEWTEKEVWTSEKYDPHTRKIYDKFEIRGEWVYRGGRPIATNPRDNYRRDSTVDPRYDDDPRLARKEYRDRERPPGQSRPSNRRDTQPSSIDYTKLVTAFALNYDPNKGFRKNVSNFGSQFGQALLGMYGAQGQTAPGQAPSNIPPPIDPGTDLEKPQRAPYWNQILSENFPDLMNGYNNSKRYTIREGQGTTPAGQKILALLIDKITSDPDPKHAWDNEYTYMMEKCGMQFHPGGSFFKSNRNYKVVVGVIVNGKKVNVN